MGFARVKSLSEDDYIAAENAATDKHEFVNGVVYAMAGASERHNTIAGNLFAACHAARKGSGRRPVMGDMRLRLEGGHTYYYPDVMLICNPEDTDPMFKIQPCMVAEISSPATEATDRREKLAAYTKLPSLREYLILSQEEMRIDHYARLSLREWGHSLLGANDSVNFQCLPLVVSVKELYATVDSGRP
jgi:Uma2 family endonuclease